MSAQEDASITVAAFICGMIAWIPVGVLMSGEPLPVSMIVCNALGLLVWWAFMFVFGLILRDTILQRGRWCIDLKRAVCSQCGKPLLKMTFLNWLKWLWNGWSCHECGFQWNKWGRPMKEKTTLAKWSVLRAVGDAEEREYRRQRLDERIQNLNEQMQRGNAS
jgi:hypothetical protein